MKNAQPQGLVQLARTMPHEAEVTSSNLFFPLFSSFFWNVCVCVCVYIKKKKSMKNAQD